MADEAAGVLEPRANPDLIGQERAEDFVRHAWRSGRFAHGWLLEGPRGVGKATLAYRIARRVLGSNDEAAWRDGSDPVFRLIRAGSHPDLHVVELPFEGKARKSGDTKPQKRKGEIPVDSIRAAALAMHRTSARGGGRVLIVDGADRLNRNAANALLKLLEEPPPGVVILLVAHRIGTLPATLPSRCARIRLRGLGTEEVREVLERVAPDGDPDDRVRAARLADGSVGRAVHMMRLGWPELHRQIMEALAEEPVDEEKRLDLARKLARISDAETFPIVVEWLQALVRRIARTVLGGDDPSQATDDEQALLRALGARAPLDRWGELWETFARSAGVVEALNLDRGQALLEMLTTMAPSATGDDAAGRSLFGGLHVHG